jgi:hypothetical protein
MGNLTAAGAAFYGFGLVRRDPLTFLGVTIIGAALTIWLVAAGGPAIAAFIQVAAAAPDDDAAVLTAMTGLFSSIGLIMLAGIPAFIVSLGALYRSLVFGSSKGWLLGLKLSMDELRVLVAWVVAYSLANLLPSIAVAILTSILTLAVLGSAAAGAGDSALAAVAGVGLVNFGLQLLSYVFMIWIGIRLSLMAAASVGENRFVLFESWSMTKGRFWTLFLAYLIYYLIYLIVVAIGVVVILAVTGGFAIFASPEGPDLSALQSIRLSPALIAGCIAYAVVSTFFTVGLIGIPARGYLSWKESAAPAVSATFA